jgi:uncharacterized protein
MTTLSLDAGRRVAVSAQLLSAPRPTSMLAVIEHLGSLQMDPTSAVARSERLVLWSRLGNYDVDALNRALFEGRSLFEWWAFILPTADFAIYREAMRRHANGKAYTQARADYRAKWMAANASFRRHVLSRLRREGPLRSRDFEDRAVLPWPSGGWNEGRNVGRMLEILWDQGVIATVGRDGAQRIWDLAERRYPLDGPRLPKREVARRVVEGHLRAKGIARRRVLRDAVGGPQPGWERALEELQRDGVAVPVTVEGLRGEWIAHGPTVEREFHPRTTLLSPFDQLIWDRRRTEELFGFRFRLEIYVPVAQREFGYFVLPILHGDRLIGRIDPMFDRGAGRLDVRAVFAEPDAPAEAGAEIAAAISELGRWLGAREVRLGRRLPSRWKAALIRGSSGTMSRRQES